MFSGLPQSCNTSHRCLYFIEELQTATLYDAFCIDLEEGGAKVLKVVPTCENKVEPNCGTVVSTSPAEDGAHEVFGLEDFLCVLLLMAYVAWSFLSEQIRVLHETGAAVLFGLLAGGFMQLVFGQTARFSYDMFSYILLPMVIFAAGFNCQKQDMFRFSGYICILGISGTVLIFVLIYFSSDLFGLRFPLSPEHRLIMASVLSSTDSVAPMAFLPAEDFPQLYAVVFGEGVLNDVVSVLLSTAISGESHMPSIGHLSLSILKFLITSSFMGLTFGFGTSLFFRRCSYLHVGAVKPCVMLLGCNYLCYVLTELFEFSPIFALFVCAVLCGHYAQHNMGKEAQKFIAELAELMAYTAEAVVFGYFGLTAVAYISADAFDWGMVFYYIACILFARVAAVAILVFVAWLWVRLRGRRSLVLSLKELCVVALAGCMRGTIAYALVLRAVPPEDDQTPTQTNLVTTVLGIVLVNCLVFGGLFPVVLKCLDIQVANPLEVQPSSRRLLRRARESFEEGTEIRHGIHRWWHNLDHNFFQVHLLPPQQASCEDGGSSSPPRPSHGAGGTDAGMDAGAAAELPERRRSLGSGGGGGNSADRSTGE